MRQLAALVETFASPMLDRTLWDTTTDGVFRDPAMPRCRIPITTDYEQLGSAGWDAVHSGVSAQISIPDPADTGGSVQVFLTIQASAAAGGADNRARLYVSGTVLTAALTVAGVTTTTALGTYDPIAHAYWQLHHTGGGFEYSTSPDGARWTEQDYRFSTWRPTDVDVSLSAGCSGTEAAGMYATIAYINTPSEWAVSGDWIVRAAVRPDLGGVDCIVDYTDSDLDGEIRNITLNPSMETNLTYVTPNDGGATSVTMTRVNTQAAYGSWSLQYTHGAAQGVTHPETWWELTGTVPSGPVTASVSIRVPAAIGTVWTWCGIWTGFEWVAAGAYEQVTVTGAWQRLERVITMPIGANANYVGWQLWGDFSGTSIHLDACMVEVGATAHAYVDGAQSGCVWEGTAHASASHRTVGIDAVTLYRTAPDGQPVEVRAARRLATPGGLSGVIEDREAPLGVPVEYRARGHAGGTTTALSEAVSVTVPPPPDRRAWLKDPGRPANNMTVRVAAGAPTESHEPRATTLTVVGDPLPRVLHDVRLAPAYDRIRIRTATTVEADALRRLLAPGSTLLLQPPPTWPTLREMYIQVGTPTGTPFLGIATDPQMVWDIPVRQTTATVGAPTGTGGITWDDVIALYDTWDDLMAANATWETLYTRPAGG